jgi:hypothetical protein
MSASNCLVAIHHPGGVDLRFGSRPGRWVTGDTAEWEAHLAEVRAAALTEAAALLRKRAGLSVFADLAEGIQYAVNLLTLLVDRPQTPLRSTEPAADAPPVPEQAPEPQGPAEGLPLTLTMDDLDAVGMRSAVALLGAESDDFLNAYGTSWTAIRESLADVQPLIARHRALRTERDNLIVMLKAREVALRQVDELRAAAEAQHDTARTAAETFRAELDRTGEQLLAMTADRDRLAETLRGTDPWAGAGLDRLADHLIEHWPARVHVANEARQVTADLAIEVIQDLCGELAECHADLARTGPVVDAAVAWWASEDMHLHNWELLDDQEAAVGRAVDAYAAGTPQPEDAP